MLCLSSNFQKTSLCSFLSRRRFIPIFAHFLEFLTQQHGNIHCTKTNSMTYTFFIMNYLLMLCFVYQQSLKKIHRVVFLVEGALYQFLCTFSRFLSQQHGSLHCAKTNSMTYTFFIMNQLLMLYFVYQQTFKTIHRVVFSVETA